MGKLGVKLKKIPEGVKASAALFFASIISTGISYLVTPVYTRLLTPEQYGQTSVFMTWMTVFGIVAMFCLNRGVYNNGMMDYPDKRDEYSFSLLILSNLITAGFSVLLLAFYPFIKNVLDIEMPFIVLMLIVFFLQPAYNFWVSRQRYEYKYKATFLFAVISAILSPGIAVLLIFLFPEQKLYARIFGAEMILVIMYAVFYVHLARKSHFRVKTVYWKEALKFNLPLIPHYLSSYVLSSSDKVMIAYLINDAAAAYYSVAHAIAAIASLLWSAINGSLTPYVYEKCKVKDYDSVSRVTMGIVGVIACGCAFIIVLAPEVLRIMATADYQEAVYVIPPIVGGFFFQVIYYIFATILYFFKRTRSVMIASLISTALNIILNYFFIQKFGYIAAGYTTLISYIIQALINYFAMKKVAGCDVYDRKLLFGFSGMMLLLSLFGGLLYKNFRIRMGVMLVTVGLVIIFRKRIVSLIRNLFQKKNGGEQTP